MPVNHVKTNSIADWTQADLDAQIALGNFPPGTLLADIVLPSDWNDDHTNPDIADITGLQTALDGKVDENAAITGATKTKITYDAKGLVTAGTDATTADISDSSNKRYVTDAQLTILGNTSGTNTGDQTSIVGITGTKAQFDTACSDGNFLYVGDVTQYTDEMAQDAVGAMVNSSLTYVDGTPSLGLTSRTINGTAFDGTANITVTAAAGTLTGGTLAAGVTASSLTSVGTIATGVWQGTAVADTYIASAATWNAKQSAITFGTGVQTALGVNIGSAGAPVLFNGAGGTPSSLTGTNITGTAAGLTAGNATTLATGRTLAITGDLAWTSPSFNGSANVTAAGTLATVNANVGSFTNANITVNAKGLITAAANGTSGGGTSVTIAGISQASHGLAVGEAVYYTGTIYDEAIATSAAAAEVVGIVSNVTDANTFDLTVAGQVTGLSSLTAGGVYFLSDTVAGQLTLTEPSTAGRISKPVLVATSTTAGIIVNYRGSVISSANSATAYTSIGLAKMISLGATL